MFHRILIAPNAFKGTLSAAQAARAMARGLRRALGAGVILQEMPVADGGDGFAQVLAPALQARWHRRRVHDALGRPITARLALARDRRTALIELAAASGLALVQRIDPMAASTFGTGELIAAALKLGGRRLKRILIGIGGSATTDGGTGLARALGVKFLDGSGREVAGGGAGLAMIEHINISALHPMLSTAGPARIVLEVACDVDNPLYGPHGAAFVFAPQKGATPAQVRQLDAGLRHLAAVVRRDLDTALAMLPGGGAAGGAGAGLAAFLGARLRPGSELVAQTLGLKAAIQKADLVITGEGRLDRQTAGGKAPAAVLRLARQCQVPIIAICGSLGPGARGLGFDALFAAPAADVPGARGAAAAQLAALAQTAGRWLLDRNDSVSKLR